MNTGQLTESRLQTKGGGMSKWVVNNRHWLFLIISVVVVVIHTVDLRHQIQDSNAGNELLGQQLKQIVSSDLARTFTSFEYIANDIVRHQIMEKRPTHWSERTEVITQLAFDDGGVLTFLYDNYGLTDTSIEYNNLINNSALIWRLNYEQENKSVSLVMGQIIPKLGRQYFIETEFKMIHYPPFIPYQMNATLIYVGFDQQALLRGHNEFEQIIFRQQSPPPPIISSNKRVVSIETSELLGFRYYQLNGDDSEQYQLIDIPVKQLNGSMKVLLNRTHQLNAIYDDIYELVASVLGLALLYVLSNYTLEYLRKTQRVMNTDVLTGLKNRRHLNYSEDKIQCNLAAEMANFYGILLLDVDHFKRVNDNYGHAIGDKVLARIGQILKENVRTGDECYRLGGEEFAITAPVMSQSQVISLAQRLRKMIEKDTELNCLVDGGVTSSIGVSALSIGGQLEESLNRADTQLYLAKHNGRNLVQYPSDLFAV